MNMSLYCNMNVPFNKQLALRLHVVPLAHHFVEALLHGGCLEGDAYRK